MDKAFKKLTYSLQASLLRPQKNNPLLSVRALALALPTKQTLSFLYHPHYGSLCVVSRKPFGAPKLFQNGSVIPTPPILHVSRPSLFVFVLPPPGHWCELCCPNQTRKQGNSSNGYLPAALQPRFATTAPPLEFYTRTIMIAPGTHRRPCKAKVNSSFPPAPFLIVSSRV